MEEAIQKLMREYDDKINDCDLMLDNITEQRNRLKTCEYIMRIDLQKEVWIWESRKQAYIQAKKDIESLLDVEQ